MSVVKNAVLLQGGATSWAIEVVVIDWGREVRRRVGVSSRASLHAHAQRVQDVDFFSFNFDFRLMASTPTRFGVSFVIGRFASTQGQLNLTNLTTPRLPCDFE